MDVSALRPIAATTVSNSSAVPSEKLTLSLPPAVFSTLAGVTPFFIAMPACSMYAPILSQHSRSKPRSRMERTAHVTG